MKKVWFGVIALMMFGVGVQAESITHGGTTINMDFVDIGHAGNVADRTGYGAVGYDYSKTIYRVFARC
jgi:hypothetical protein